MKISYSIRSYRAQTGNADEKAFQAQLEESDLWIVCLKNTPADLPEQVLRYLGDLRASLKGWMNIDPQFGPSLTPLPQRPEAPEIAQRMLRAGAAMRVGPMAAVAGAVAQAVCERFAQYSSEFVVENGGDIFMRSTRERRVALLPDPSSGSAIGLKFRADMFPLAVCSSSSTIGHSLSFGKGELVTVVGKDAALADAAATRYCNLLQGPKDIEKILEMARKNPMVTGVFAQCGEQMGLWGDMELVAL